MPSCLSCFFYNDNAAIYIYTFSLHYALPISAGVLRDRLDLRGGHERPGDPGQAPNRPWPEPDGVEDRKSTRLNSSHVAISYAVSCLKKKTITYEICFESFLSDATKVLLLLN